MSTSLPPAATVAAFTIDDGGLALSFGVTAGSSSATFVAFGT